MRKLTASILATAVLAGGALSGGALAATPTSHAQGERTSINGNATSRDRADNRSRHESTTRDRASHDRAAHEQRAQTRDR